MSVNAVSQRSIAVVLLALFLGMSFSPFGELWIEQAEAAEVARHTYEFSDGTTEYIALYQGGNADSGAKIALPKGAQVTDVQMTLSGASATDGLQFQQRHAIIGLLERHRIPTTKVQT